MLPPIGHVTMVNTGRAALVLAIKALGLPMGAKIGVPLFCCPVVFEAITVAGCVPCFLDVDPTTFCLSPEDLRRKRPTIEALVAVHMFGNACAVPDLRSELLGIPIIEDCAQAIGSRLGDKALGSFGDIAFFSFRSGKYVSAGEGGALFAADAPLRAVLSRLVLTLPNHRRADELAHVLKVYTKSRLRGVPLYGLIGRRLWAIHNSQGKDDDRSSIRASRIYSTDLSTIQKRLLQLASAISRQRQNAAYYERSLEMPSEMLCKEKPGAFYNRYLFPVTLPSRTSRDAMHSHLLRNGVDTMKYLDGVVETAKANYAYRGDCPVSESLSTRVLVIPSYHTLDDEAITRICLCTNESWSVISGRSSFGVQRFK